MEPFIIYHKGCPDGAGAALAANLKFGDKATYYPAGHGTPFPYDKVASLQNVYVLDFSWPYEVMKEVSKNSFLTVVDHHDSAGPDLYKLREEHPFHLLFDTSRSGAVLAWQFFHPDIPVPELFLYLEDRDLWKWALPDSKAISAALFSYGITYDFKKLASFFTLWETAPETTRSNLAHEGTAILRSEGQMIQSAVRQRETVRIGDVQCYATNTPFLASEIGNVMAMIDADHPVAICYSYIPSSKFWKFELRSVGEFHVGNLAKHVAQQLRAVYSNNPNITGGGHKNAAGFQCPTLNWTLLGAIP